jgi:hypothetical protein
MTNVTPLPPAVTSIVIASSAFLNGGTIVNGGTISSPTLAATGLLGGTVGAQATNIPLSTRLALSGGTLDLGSSAMIRTIPFPMVGTLVGGQDMIITLTQAGTLLANGGAPQAQVKGRPTASNTLTLNTINSGTVHTQGTVSVNTGGTVTFPTFAAVPWAAGDSIELINQATADLTFANACLSFQFEVT